MAQESFEKSAKIDATAMQVLAACLDPQALKVWWKARTAIVQPRPGGLFVLEWEPGSLGQDDLLGPMGGTLTGILDKSMAGHFVHLGALHSITPRGEVFGPIRCEVDVFSKGDPRRKPTLVRVKVEGFQSGDRWARYREVVERMWDMALPGLVAYCESHAADVAEGEKYVESLGDAYLADAVLKDRHIS